MKTLLVVMALALVAGGAHECGGGNEWHMDSNSNLDGSDGGADAATYPSCKWVCVYGGGECPGDFVPCDEQTCFHIGSEGVCCGPPEECQSN